MYFEMGWIKSMNAYRQLGVEFKLERLTLFLGVQQPILCLSNVTSRIWILSLVLGSRTSRLFIDSHWRCELLVVLTGKFGFLMENQTLAGVLFIAHLSEASCLHVNPWWGSYGSDSCTMELPHWSKATQHKRHGLAFLDQLLTASLWRSSASSVWFLATMDTGWARKAYTADITAWCWSMI